MHIYSPEEQHPNFNVKVIDHLDQRYNTVGDYFFQDGAWQVRISKMPDAREEQLILHHELTELLVVIQQGVSQGEIDAFDMDFEARRSAGGVPIEAEPGDDSEAPYYEAHKLASKLERELANALGVDWEAYYRHCEALTTLWIAEKEKKKQ